MRKKKVYDRLINRVHTEKFAKYAEKIIGMTFEEEGYYVSNRVAFKRVGEELEIDLLCLKDGLKVGVEVKNRREVILDPMVMKRKDTLHADVERHLTFIRQHGFIPILMAPFIDKSFYRFDDRHQGLHCQYLSVLIPPEEQDLVSEVKKELGFGWIKAVDSPPENIVKWVRKIPEMMKRHGRIA